jgi:hypothetical protein
LGTLSPFTGVCSGQRPAGAANLVKKRMIPAEHRPSASRTSTRRQTCLRVRRSKRLAYTQHPSQLTTLPVGERAKIRAVGCMRRASAATAFTSLASLLLPVARALVGMRDP